MLISQNISHVATVSYTRVCFQFCNNSYHHIIFNLPSLKVGLLKCLLIIAMEYSLPHVLAIKSNNTRFMPTSVTVVLAT